MSLALHTTHIQSLNTANHVPVLAQWLVSCAVTVTKWDARYRSRKQLVRLSDNHLRDIGLDRLTARGEASKSFWQD